MVVDLIAAWEVEVPGASHILRTVFTSGHFISNRPSNSTHFFQSPHLFQCFFSVQIKHPSRSIDGCAQIYPKHTPALGGVGCLTVSILPTIPGGKIKVSRSWPSRLTP